MNRLDLSDPLGTKDQFLNTDATICRVHLRVQQRNARQKITTVEGLPAETNFKQLCKDIKKRLCCNGSIAIDPNNDASILHFTGDQRQDIAEILVSKKFVENRSDITIHGY